MPYQPTEELRIADRIYKTAIQGLYYLSYETYKDERGYFGEIAIIPDLNQIFEVPFTIKQINQAHSVQNVIRGFHKESWRKLIWVTQGQVFSALVDARPDSPTYKKVETFFLGEQERALSGALFISAGIANSVCVTAGPVDYNYAVDALYRDRDVNGDTPISLFDPNLNIAWPIARESMIISERDLKGNNLT